MINFSTIPSPSIVAIEVSKTKKVGLWNSISKIFWAHVEQCGAADTKSFDGLL